jgi:hypothetical protein
LRVSGDASAVFCGKKRNVRFSPDKGICFKKSSIIIIFLKAVSKFDVTFQTNKNNQGKGFQCTVSCVETQSTTTATTVQLDDCECGLPNRIKRIVGGIKTEVNEYPWQVISLKLYFKHFHYFVFRLDLHSPMTIFPSVVALY